MAPEGMLAARGAALVSLTIIPWERQGNTRARETVDSDRWSSR